MPSPASRPAPVELLAAFDRVMQVGRWRWYVFGAQAVVAYGRPRMTADVDVTVDLGETSSRELIDLLQQHGFDARFDLSDDFLATAHLLPLAHKATRMPVDLVIAQPGLQSEFLGRCRRVDVGGYVVPLISVEDLIATKVLAARRKDLEDVRGVLCEQWDSIDFGRIDLVLSELELALDDHGLKRRLDRIVRQVRKLLAGP